MLLPDIFYVLYIFQYFILISGIYSSTLYYNTCYIFQYSAEVSQLADRAKCLVRDLDPTNELTFVRIASRQVIH